MFEYNKIIFAYKINNKFGIYFSNSKYFGLVFAVGHGKNDASLIISVAYWNLIIGYYKNV